MSIFVNFVLSFLTSIIAWFVRKFGLKAVLLTIQKTVQALMLVVFISASYFFIDAVNQIYTIVSSFVANYNTMSISAQIGENNVADLFFGVMDATGVGLAFVTTMNLYISIILLRLGMYLWNVLQNVTKLIYRFIDDTLKLLAA